MIQTTKYVRLFNTAIREKRYQDAIAIHDAAALNDSYPQVLKNYFRECINKFIIESGSRNHLKSGSEPETVEIENNKLCIRVDNASRSFIKGWTWLPSEPDRKLHVSLIVNGHIVDNVIANKYRKDLADAGLGNGCHGFIIQPQERLNTQATGFTLRVDQGDGKFLLYECDFQDVHQSNSTTISNPVSDKDKLRLLHHDHDYFCNPGLLFEEDYPRIEGSSANKTLARIIAFYLPQFHRIPINDKTWGKGFTEWRQLPKSMPRFPGHYQPRTPRDLGFYDLTNNQILEEQACLAASAGIEAFCFYYYSFGTQRVLDAPLDAYASKQSLPTNFLIMWANENWTKTWDGLDSHVFLKQEYLRSDEDWNIHELARYLSNPNYFRIGDRPLLIIYRPLLIPDPIETISRWRERFRSRHGLDPLIFCALGFGLTDPSTVGCDGAIEFPPHRLASKSEDLQVDPFFSGYNGRVIEYDSFIKASLDAKEEDTFPVIKTAVPSWDNDARRPCAGFSLAHSSPFKFQAWLTQLIHRAVSQPVYGESIVAINAWNEWAEAAYLEPDCHYGSAYLNACFRSSVSRDHQPSLKSCLPIKVSVVLPCFNHSSHLHERLTSVINQTVPPDEIVFLDDASSDDSVQVAKAILSESGIPYQIVVNDENSGSVFKQWLKGIDLCSNEIIWIAETDDTCEYDFLEHCLVHFNSKSVRGVLGKITCIDKNGTTLDDLDNYYSGLFFHSWNFPYTITAAKSFTYDFSVTNVIPNASGFVFRRPLLLEEEVQKILGFSFSGDWLFYAYLLRGGSLVYEPAAISYFRKSADSASRSKFGTDIHLNDHKQFIRHVSETYGFSEKSLLGHAYRLSKLFTCYSLGGLLEELKPQVLSRSVLRICIAAHSFSVGGGEVVPLQLANKLREQGHHVTYLLLERVSPTEHSIESRLRSDIPIVYLDEIEHDINGFFIDYRFDLLNSHNFGVEHHLCRLKARLSCKWVVSMHGGHETVANLLNDDYLMYVSKRVTLWLYLSKKNIDMLENAGLPSGACFKKTFNGVDVDGIEWVDRQAFRAQYGLTESHLALVLCSRAIPEKGWDIACDVVIALNNSSVQCHLFLIGDGPEKERIELSSNNHSYIHLLGAVNSPIRLFRAFDLAIFPTSYKGESYPMFLVESIVSGIPVISTALGEIENIIKRDPSRPAGITIEPGLSSEALKENMIEKIKDLISDKAKYRNLQLNSQSLVDSFSIDAQVEDILS